MFFFYILLLSPHSSGSRDSLCYFYKLLAVKHGDLELDLFSNLVLDTFIEFYVLINFYCALIVVYFCKILVIK